MKIVKYLFLITTIALNCYLIYHSTLPGEVSSKKTEVVTDSVVNVIDKVNPSNDSITSKYEKNRIHLFVRKIFGHFGAFMVCSFFALMTIIFFLKNNYLRFGLAFLNGTFLAILTELIQLHTEGRYGTIKDVFIDLAGYISMMIIIGLIMVIIYLVRKGKGNYEKKYI